MTIKTIDDQEYLYVFTCKKCDKLSTWDTRAILYQPRENNYICNDCHIKGAYYIDQEIEQQITDNVDEAIGSFLNDDFSEGID